MSPTLSQPFPTHFIALCIPITIIHPHAVITVSAAIYFGCVQTYRTGYRTGGYSKHETLALFVLWAIAITVMVMLVALKKPGARTKALCDEEGHEQGHEEDDGVVGAEAVTEARELG